MARGRKKQEKKSVTEEKPKRSRKKKEKADGGAGNPLQILRSQFGDSVSTLSGRGATKIRGVSWGVPSINFICTGRFDIGIVDGRIYEIYGPFSSGKTTLCLQGVAQLQRAGRTVLYVDVEHAVSLAYAKALGVDTDKLIFAQPTSGEQAMQIMRDGINAGCGAVFLDSIPALIPKRILEGNFDKEQMGGRARLLGEALPVFATLASDKGVPIVLVNQVRTKIGEMFGDPETTPGGQAPKFYASIRLRMALSQAKNKAVKGNSFSLVAGPSRDGSTARIEAKKNKIFDPFHTCEVPLFYGRGFDAGLDLLNVATRVGVVKKSKGAYRIGDKGPGFSLADVDVHWNEIMGLLNMVDISSIKAVEETVEEVGEE